MPRLIFGSLFLSEVTYKWRMLIFYQTAILLVLNKILQGLSKFNRGILIPNFFFKWSLDMCSWYSYIMQPHFLVLGGQGTCFLWRVFCLRPPPPHVIAEFHAARDRVKMPNSSFFLLPPGHLGGRRWSWTLAFLTLSVPGYLINDKYQMHWKWLADQGGRKVAGELILFL